MDRTLSHRLFRIAASTVVLAGMLAAPTIAGEDFEGGSPYNWSKTLFPLIIRNGHTEDRPQSMDLCLPGPDGGMAFRVTRTDMDREGRFAAGATAPTGEAYALRRNLSANILADSRIEGYVSPGSTVGGAVPFRAGFVARALVTGGASPHIIDAYAAVVQFDPPRTTAGAFIVRLHGDIISDASTEILTTPVNFDAACATNCRVVFTVIGSSLSMKVYSVYVHPGTGEVTTSLVTDVTATDTALGAGLNGCVASAPANGAVYFDDVSLFRSIASVSFDGATPGTLVGGQAGQIAGDLIHTESGVSAHLAEVTPPGMGSEPIFGSGQFVTTPGGLGGGVGLSLTDLAILFSGAGERDLFFCRGRLPGLVPTDRWINLAVNGLPGFVGALSDADSDDVPFDICPFVLDGQSGGQNYTVDITGPISSVQFGGHNVIIDAAYFADEVTPCPADFDGDGTVGVPDIFAFLAQWFAGDASADSNGDGEVNVPDIFDFLARWFAGC